MNLSGTSERRRGPTQYATFPHPASRKRGLLKKRLAVLTHSKKQLVGAVPYPYSASAVATARSNLGCRKRRTPPKNIILDVENLPNPWLKPPLQTLFLPLHQKKPNHFQLSKCSSPACMRESISGLALRLDTLDTVML